MIRGIMVLAEKWFITPGHAKFERPFVYLHENVLEVAAYNDLYLTKNNTLDILDLMILVHDAENMKMNEVGLL